jgi:MATE family multidrug resistance protein
LMPFPSASAVSVGSEHPTWRLEIAETAKLALPMALTQLGQVAMMTTDLALIGRLGDGAVAAVSLAHLILFSGFVLGMGPMSAVAPLASQAFGARDPRMVRRTIRVGLWAAVLLGAPINVAQLWGQEILMAAGQDSETAALAARYLAGLAWSMIPAWGFIAIRNFMGALNRPEPALWVTLAAIPLNGILAYGLIYGAFGLPRLDLLGAGLATTLTNIGMCAVGIWICSASPPFRKFHVFGRFWRPDWSLLQKLFVIGVPISGAMLLEWGLFSSAALLVGWLGRTQLAAHQIALQLVTIIFMVPFGISVAATVRVGHAVGRGDAIGTRRAAFSALALGAAVLLAITLSVVLFRRGIPIVFLGGEARDSETAGYVTSLLLIGATFFINDGMQGIAAGALRGLNDTAMPLLFALVSFWLVGFTSAYWLAFHAHLGVFGVWIGFSLSVATFAALLVWRLQLLTSRGYMPAIG